MTRIALAADNPGFLDPLTWINFGALGLVVIGMITGWLWTKPAVDRLIAEKDRAVRERERAEAERAALAQALMPILHEIRQLQQLMPLLHDLVRQHAESRERPVLPGPAPRHRL